MRGTDFPLCNRGSITNQENRSSLYQLKVSIECSDILVFGSIATCQDVQLGNLYQYIPQSTFLIREGRGANVRRNSGNL